MDAKALFLRRVYAGLGAALPAALLAVIADALMGFATGQVHGVADILSAIFFSAALLGTASLALGLGGSIVLASLAEALDPWMRVRAICQAAASSRDKDCAAAAVLLSLPVAAGVLIAGSASTQALWVRSMVNPRLGAMATGLLSLLWLAPSLALVFPAFLILRFLLGKVRGPGRIPEPRLSLLALLLLALGMVASVVLLATLVDLSALPLRPLGVLGVMAAGLLLMAGAASRDGTARGLRGLRSPAIALIQAGLIVLALVITLFLFGDRPGPAKAILSGRTLSRELVLVGRRLLDRDGDGYSALLGGGDCNDDDPLVHPAALEIPGDGIDNNCLGGDAPPEASPGGRQEDPRAAAPEPGAADQRPDGSVPAAEKPSGPAPTEILSSSSAAERAAASSGPAMQDASSGMDAVPRAARPAKSLPGPFNVLAILVDTVRADHVGAYGYKRLTTPHIDEFAASASLFERCYAQSPHTPRSIPSIMTSRHPSRIAWYRPRRSYPVIKKENLSFAEVLGEQGVHTGLAASHFYFGPKYGILQGFQAVDNTGAKSLTESNKDTASPRIYARVHPRLARLKELSDSGKRFMLFVHLFEPHSTSMRHKPPDFFGKGWMDLYDGEIHFSDRYVGKILARLEEVGLADSTAVLIFADHGEGNGEHGFKWHGQHIYSEVMHVPLIIRVPGLPSRRISVPVALIDLAPTIVELAGATVPESFEGRSLLPALMGRDLSEIPIFGQLLPYPYCKEEVHSIVVGEWKLIFHRSHNTWSLYNLRQDRLEARDLLSEEPAMLEMLRGRLLRWLESGG